MKALLSLVALALLVQCAQAIPVGPDGGYAEYNPLTGEVIVSSNHAGAIVVESIDESNIFLPANAVPSTAVPKADFLDPEPNSITYLTFDSSGLGTGDPGILDDFSIGSILPIGISSPNGQVPNARFRWLVAGVGEFSGPLHIIPEPSSWILAGIAGIGLLPFARRKLIGRSAR